MDLLHGTGTVFLTVAEIPGGRQTKTISKGTSTLAFPATSMSDTLLFSLSQLLHHLTLALQGRIAPVLTSYSLSSRNVRRTVAWQLLAGSSDHGRKGSKCGLEGSL